MALRRGLHKPKERQVCFTQQLPDGSWGYQTSTGIENRDWHAKTILIKRGMMISMIDAGYDENTPSGPQLLAARQRRPLS